MIDLTDRLSLPSFLDFKGRELMASRTSGDAEVCFFFGELLKDSPLQMVGLICGITLLLRFPARVTGSILVS